MITLDLKDAYQRLFWEETNSQILAFEQDVLKVEGGVYTQETIERMFRTAHSMKGSSATIGAVEIMRVSHLLEDLLNVLKTNHAAFDVLSEVKEATHQLEASVDMYLLALSERLENPVMKPAEPDQNDTEALIEIIVHFDEAAEMLWLKSRRLSKLWSILL